MKNAHPKEILTKSIDSLSSKVENKINTDILLSTLKTLAEGKMHNYTLVETKDFFTLVEKDLRSKLNKHREEFIRSMNELFDKMLDHPQVVKFPNDFKCESLNGK